MICRVSLFDKSFHLSVRGYSSTQAACARAAPRTTFATKADCFVSAAEPAVCHLAPMENTLLTDWNSTFLAVAMLTAFNTLDTPTQLIPQYFFRTATYMSELVATLERYIVMTEYGFIIFTCHASRHWWPYIQYLHYICGMSRKIIAPEYMRWSGG
jgi:hypothetical protein